MIGCHLLSKESRTSITVVSDIFRSFHSKMIISDSLPASLMTGAIEIEQLRVVVNEAEDSDFEEPDLFLSESDSVDMIYGVDCLMEKR